MRRGLRLVALLPVALVCLGPARAGSRPPQKRQKTTRPGTTKKDKGPVFRARHILIPWKSSAGTQPDTTRSKLEAQKLAEEILVQLRDGKSFADLAAQHSSEPSRLEGGDLGQFRPGEDLYDFFVAWVEAAKIDKVVGPKESRFGFHIIKRLAVKRPWPELVSASHIMISFTGAMNQPAHVSRSKEEARLIAGRALAELKTEKITFVQAAKKYSDDVTTRDNGGSLGTRRPISCITVKCADRICALEVGDIGGPIETPFGFHILLRNELDRPWRASHILVAWKGAKNAPDQVVRSRADAMVLAGKLIERLGQGESFTKLARQYSNGLSATRGGDLGLFRRREMVPAFEKAVAEATIGTIVGPVETVHGYHIILRTQ